MSRTIKCGQTTSPWLASRERVGSSWVSKPVNRKKEFLWEHRNETERPVRLTEGRLESAEFIFVSLDELHQLWLEVLLGR